MAELGNGAVREVTSIRLSRAACMAVAMNGDQKKEEETQLFFKTVQNMRHYAVTISIRSLRVIIKNSVQSNEPHDIL